MPTDPTPLQLVILPGLDGTGMLGQRLHDRLRGSVLLAYPRDRVLSFDELVDLVRASIARHERVVLIGESYSAVVALRYAARYPEQVAGVVVTAGFISPPWTRALAHVMWAWWFRIRPPRWIVRWLFAGWDADDQMTDHVIAAVRSVKPEVVSGRLKQVLTMDHSSAVRGVRVPVLYVAGESDRLVKRGSIDRVRDVLPQTKVVRVPGPHVLSQTQPEPVAAAIEAFVAEISGVS